MSTARELLDQGIRYETGGVLERALTSYRDAAKAAGQDPSLKSEALRREAGVLRSRCDWDAAVAAARASATLAREHGLDDLLAEALNAEAATFHARGAFDDARTLYEEMLTLTTTHRIRGIALQNLGSLKAQQGDYEGAEDRFIESFECFQRDGYTRGVVMALTNYGRAALDRDAHAVAHPVLVRAETLARELMDLDLLATARINLAECLMHRGELEEAQELASAALGYFGNTENHWRRIECLRLMGEIALVQDREDSARNFFEAGLRLARLVDARNDVRVIERRLAELPSSS